MYGLDVVRLGFADRRGTHEDAVAVVVNIRVVAHVMNRELLRVALADEVLPVEVRDGHALLAKLVNDVQAEFVSFSRRSKIARLYWKRFAA